MSSSGTITVAAPPNTASVASQILASMAALSGVVTDYNTGSQVRTFAEAVGATEEQQGIWTQAIAFQAVVYSALSLFNIVPNAAVAASGIVSIQTAASGTLPPASQSVPIPIGTLVQTNGGVQFQTTAPVVLLSGTNAINAPVIAVTPGAAGNVPANSILNIVTGLIYPLFVTNPSPTTGGADAETATSALARFAAEVSSIGLASPVAIANAAIGVSVGNESVAFSTLYEGWIAAGSGAGSGTAGWELFIDNGTGTASSGLIAAVNAKITGGTVSGASNAGGATGYRDAGVPYSVNAVTPTFAIVDVSGTITPTASLPAIDLAVTNAVNAYFSLPFGASADQSQISAQVSNSAYGQFTSLSVALFASGASGAVSTLCCSPSGRIVLATLNLSITSGS